MEELIFFAVIIFFSIVESIARSRRAKQGEAEGQAPPPDLSRPESWEPPRSRTPEVEPLPTYDADPSYDDMAMSRGGRSRRDQPSPMRGGSRPEERGRPSSEMLSADLLEELAELAGQRERQGRTRRPRPVRIPRQSPPLPEPVEQGRTRLPVKATEVGEHPVHRSHAGYGTDPSSRPRSEQDVLYAPKERLGADAAAVRRQLLSHSASSLRQAIILQEVLGPPIAMREDDSAK